MRNTKVRLFLTIMFYVACILAMCLVFPLLSFLAFQAGYKIIGGCLLFLSATLIISVGLFSEYIQKQEDA